MIIRIFFKSGPNSLEDYQDPLNKALSDTGLEYQLTKNIPSDHVDYIIYAPSSGFTPYTCCKAVLCLWAHH